MIDKNLTIKIQRECIEQLHSLVPEYFACSHTLNDVVQGSRDCEETLKQLQYIVDEISALHLTKPQTRLLLCFYTVLLKVTSTDSEGEDTRAVIYKLKMMLETNESVWLLCDGLDWLVPEIGNMLLQQTGGDEANQCPKNGHEQVLLQKFTGLLDDWRGCLDKQ